MNNWFQTDAAYRLMASCREDMLPIRVQTDGCVGIAAVMGPWFARRAIVQGGVRIDNPDGLQSLLQQLKEQCREYRCVYIELRNFADYTAYKNIFNNEGFIYEPHYDILIDTSDHKAMWGRLHESKRRKLSLLLDNDCKEQNGSGIVWREAETEADVRTFYTCLQMLYRRKIKRPLPSRHFFVEAWRQGVTVLVTEEQGSDGRRMINGGVLVPVMETTAYEWYICGQIMSTWAVMEWCNAHGVATLDTMGAGVPGVPYGVRDFKLQMGGTLHEYGRFIYVADPLRYRIGKKIMENKIRKI